MCVLIPNLDFYKHQKLSDRLQVSCLEMLRNVSLAFGVCFVILGRSGHYFAWIIVQILGPLLTMKVMMPVLSLSCLSFIVAVYSQ